MVMWALALLFAPLAACAKVPTLLSETTLEDIARFNDWCMRQSDTHRAVQSMFTRDERNACQRTVTYTMLGQQLDYLANERIVRRSMVAMNLSPFSTIAIVPYHLHSGSSAAHSEHGNVTIYYSILDQVWSVFDSMAKTPAMDVAPDLRACASKVATACVHMKVCLADDSLEDMKTVARLVSYMAKRGLRFSRYGGEIGAYLDKSEQLSEFNSVLAVMEESSQNGLALLNDIGTAFSIGVIEKLIEHVNTISRRSLGIKSTTDKLAIAEEATARYSAYASARQNAPGEDSCAAGLADLPHLATLPVAEKSQPGQRSSGALPMAESGQSLTAEAEYLHESTSRKQLVAAIESRMKRRAFAAAETLVRPKKALKRTQPKENIYVGNPVIPSSSDAHRAPLKHTEPDVERMMALDIGKPVKFDTVTKNSSDNLSDTEASLLSPLLPGDDDQANRLLWEDLNLHELFSEEQLDGSPDVADGREDILGLPL